MYRVYCKIGRYRYYWSKANIWSMWSWAAKPLTLEDAMNLANKENAHLEPMGQ